MWRLWAVTPRLTRAMAGPGSQRYGSRRWTCSRARCRSSGLAGVAAGPPRRLDLEVVATPRLDPDDLAAAGDADALLGRLVALHLRHVASLSCLAPAASAGRLRSRSSRLRAGAAVVCGSAAGAAAGRASVRRRRCRRCRRLGGRSRLPAAGAGASACRLRPTAAAGRCRSGVAATASPGPRRTRVLAVRGVVALGLVDRCHRDVHRLAFEQRRPLDDAVLLDLLREPRQQVSADLRVGQLPAAELDRDLDPVAVLEELDRATDLRVEVTRCRSSA